METFLFIAFFALIPAGCATILKWSNVRLDRISVLTVFFYSYILLSYAGLLPLYFYMDPYRVETGITDRNIITLCLLLSGTCLFMLCSGVWVGSRLFTRKGEAACAVLVRDIGRMGRMVLVMSWICCLVVFMMYIARLGHLPLTAALSGHSEIAASIRSDISGSSGKAYYFTMFFADMLPFLAYAAVASALLRRTGAARVLALLVVCSAVVTLIADAQKAPVLYLACGCAILYLKTRNIRLSVSRVIVAGLAGVVLMLLVQTIVGATRNRSIGELAYIVLSRLAASSGVSYYYVEMFPGSRGFLWGVSLPNPAHILPFEPFPLTREVYKFAFPMSGLSGSAPAVFWTDLYANFSWYGVVLISPLIGICLVFLDWMLARMPAHSATFALTAWCAVHYSQLSLTGIGGYMIDTSLAMVLVSYILLLLAGTNDNGIFAIDGTRIVKVLPGRLSRG